VVASNQGYPRGFREQAPIQYEPRFGLAYDPFGDGKTAIRAGFGIFHNTVAPGVRGFSQNPPTQQTPTVYYGSLSNYLSSTGVLFPNNTSTFERRGDKVPAMYNFTLGVQRDIGRGTVLELTYVGNVGRHLQVSRNLNTVPYGARFLAQNADPSNPATPLPDNFFRPYPGWGSITYNEFSSTSNYNSGQATLNRRFARGLSISLAYTYSKAMGYANSDGDGIALYRPLRVWNYGKLGFDQTHMFVGNYIWDLPRGSKLVPSKAGRLLLDNWQVSGITTFASGFPTGVGFSTVDVVDLAGGGDGTRINVTGKAQLSYGERTFSRFFNPGVFARPARAVSSRWRATGARAGVLTVRFPSPQTVSVLDLGEAVEQGQRVERWTVHDATTGQRLASGTTIGMRQLRRISPLAVSAVRLTVETVDDVQPVTLRAYG